MQRISGNDRHPADWERQREQLSAYLDGELAAGERTELERHLPECLACRDELRTLHDLRAVLRALPAPVPPRSFALPEDGAVPHPLSRERATGPATTRPAAAGRTARLAQWCGGVAASLGLALLLGGAIAAHGGPSAAEAPVALGASSSGHPAQATSATPPASTPGSALTHTPGLNQATATGTAGTTGAGASPTSATPTPSPSPSPSATTFGLPDRGNKASSPSANSVPPVVPLGGAGLFVGGAAVFVAGRRAARRRSAA
jgi:hypothetical protein